MPGIETHQSHEWLGLEQNGFYIPKVRTSGNYSHYIDREHGEEVSISFALFYFWFKFQCQVIDAKIREKAEKLIEESGFTYINRESDLGVAGLREAKLRYHPDHMVEVYSLKRDS